jgi:ribosomal protein S18
MSRGLEYLDEDSEDYIQNFERIQHKPREYTGADKKQQRQIQVRKAALERNALKRTTPVK